jgi:DEAD/DEAH box helicase domain-containing protein
MNRITGKTSTIEEWIEQLRLSPEIMEQVTSWRTIPARDAKYADMPAGLHPKIRQSLSEKGISQLYTHQHDAFVQVTSGHDVVTVPLQHQVRRFVIICRFCRRF